MGNYSSYFIVEQVEMQRDEVTCLRLHDKWWNQIQIQAV